ncbi:Rossmann fold nucleotide-binding protein Smf [Cutibacterium acnes JCM 18918]|nr:Rossmann fold nucleotide-binding protein Smf [Cutibacterium acnes JCM 18918]
MTWTSERLARAALTAAAEPGVMAKRLVEMTAEELWQHMLTDLANDGTNELNRSTSINSWSGRKRLR